jgi:hypothetical protein
MSGTSLGCAEVETKERREGNAMKKYLVTRYSNKITMLYVDRETANYVWVTGDKDRRGHYRKRSKTSDGKYFATWDEANTYVIDRLQREIETLELRHSAAEAELAHIRQATESETTTP